MHTAHAHAPVSPASRRFPLNPDSVENPDQDLADKFLSLLQNLVSRPGSPEAEVEVRAAELKLKEKKEESPQQRGDQSRPAPDAPRAADTEDNFDDTERASEPAAEKLPAEFAPVEDLVAVAIAPFVQGQKVVQVQEQKVEEKPVEARPTAALPTANQPMIEVKQHIAQPHSQTATKLEEAALDLLGNTDKMQVLAGAQKIAIKSEQKGEFRAEVQFRPEPAAVAQAQPAAESPSLKAEIKVEKTVESVAPGEESLLLPASPELSELRTPERALNSLAAEAQKKPVEKDSALRVDLPHLLGELSVNALPGRGVAMPERLPERAEQLFGISLSNEKSRGVVTNANGRAQALNARQEAIINQINKLLDRAAQAKDGSSFTVKIQPEELGEVLVKVTQRGDQLFARIVPEHKEVEQTVRVGINELVSQLINSGFRAENIHVSVGKESSETALFNGKFSNFSNLLGNHSDQGARGEQKGSGGHGSRLSEGTVRGEPKAEESGWVA
jgi:flagellar hook-length control protein FliK